MTRKTYSFANPWRCGVPALLALLASPLAACLGAGAPVENPKKDPLMGIWQGKVEPGDGGAPVEFESRIAALGEGKYSGTTKTSDGGVSTVDYTAKETEDGYSVTGTATIDGSVVRHDLTVADGKVSGTVDWGTGSGKLTGKRVMPKPPTLGAKPPEGAVVLLSPEKGLEGWTRVDGAAAGWKEPKAGVIESTRTMINGLRIRSDIVTKEEFGDHRLHLEFRTPFMPTARGQARGNSGVYVHGRYEVQVLDSFGQPPRDNEAGGIYKVSVPRVNASLPPGQWQTYDIDFRAPKLDGEGKQVEPARITVKHNGVVIHDDVVLENPTPGGVSGLPAEAGPLLLQDHGDPVRFRNIWALPLSGTDG